MSSKFDYIETEVQLSRMVGGALCENEIEIPFILDSLEHLSTARLFTRHAVVPEWLPLLDKLGVLNSLFDIQCKLTTTESELCSWIADRFVINHCDTVLQLIQKHGGTLNARFWNEIIDEVAFHRGKVRPSSKTLAVWVTVLLDNVPSNDVNASRYFGHLLGYCDWPGDRYPIIAVLSHLLRPIPIPDIELSSISMKKTEFEYGFRIETIGDEYSLDNAWNKFRSKLPEFWRSLLPTIEKYFTDAYELNRAFKKEYDPQSTWRSAIRKHEQDLGVHRGFDILIDISRDILEYVLCNDNLQKEAIALVESWYASDVPLLNRLAIHGRAFGNCWSPDQKIEWLLESDLIFNPSRNYKNEIFYLIEVALPNASSEIVLKLISVVLNKKIDRSAELEEENSIRPYERYNLLYWMAQKATSSEEVRNAFDAFSNAHPNFGPQEYPDLDVWTSGAHHVISESPIDSQKLIEKPLEETVRLLDEFKGRHQYAYDDDRRGLLEELTGAVNRNFDWSMLLANYLIDVKQLKSDIWYHLVKGWTVTPLTEEQLDKVLNFLIVNPAIHSKTSGPSSLLEDVIKKRPDLSEKILKNMESLSDVIWKELEKMEESERCEGDWLNVAINHSSGMLCEFWLHALHKRKQISGEQWTIIPEDYKKRFTEAVKGKSYAGQLARCVLASRTHYLFSMDREWTKSSLIKLFDFEKDRIAADQAWSGYLAWGQLRPELNVLLKPYYLQAAKHIKRSNDQVRNKLFVNITDIMLMDTEPEADKDWLYSALSHAFTTDEDRQEILTRIWQTLREADDGFKRSLWKRWFKDFWIDRISNRPVPLSDQESNKMLELLPRLGPVFDEVVELALRLNIFRFEYTHLYSDLSESELVTAHPDKVNKLLVHLLSKSGESTNQGRYLQVLFEKLSKVLSETEIRELKNILVKLGVISAIRPSDSLDSR